MSSRIKRRRAQQRAGRPSTFFLVALAIGLIVVVFAFIQMLPHR